MRSRTFTKENQKKMNEIIRDLKVELRQRDKEVRFLREEIDNITKPARERRAHVEVTKQTHEEWKKDFILRFKKEVLGE